MKTVDLHVHSVVSDGSCHPAELAKLAKEHGLAAFALTDHDIIDGNEEAAAAAAEYGVEFINGMELTAEFNGRKVHIVCLGFDPQHPSFQRIYQRIRTIKEGRIPEMIAYIKDKGVLKTVRFDYRGSDEQTWSATIYRLEDYDKLPDTVLDEYAKYRVYHPDFNYSEVYRVETKDGIYYGLKSATTSLTVYFKA